MYFGNIISTIWPNYNCNVLDLFNVDDYLCFNLAELLTSYKFPTKCNNSTMYCIMSLWLHQPYLYQPIKIRRSSLQLLFLRKFWGIRHCIIIPQSSVHSTQNGSQSSDWILATINDKNDYRLSPTSSMIF